MASARRATAVKPTAADREAQAAQFQVQLAHSFHDARDWVSATLPGPIGDAINDAKFLVRRLVLPTGEHVGIHGTAECVAARDCSGKDLTGAQHHDEDLGGVDFTGADLNHANFQNADFSTSATAAGPRPAASTTVTANAVIQPGADLSGANLSGSDLRGAILTGANLANANLTKANLTGANLTNTNLSGVNFTGANLSGVIFINANVTGANFTGTNLTGKITFAERAIPQYLEQLPDSADTVENISRFWIPWGDFAAAPVVTPIMLALPVVTTIALERLEAAGLVQRLLTPNGVIWRGSRQPN